MLVRCGKPASRAKEIAQMIYDYQYRLFGNGTTVYNSCNVKDIGGVLKFVIDGNVVADYFEVHEHVWNAYKNGVFKSVVSKKDESKVVAVICDYLLKNERKENDAGRKG